MYLVHFGSGKNIPLVSALQLYLEVCAKLNPVTDKQRFIGNIKHL